MCSCPLSTVRFLKAIGAGKGGEEDRGPVVKDLTKCKTLLDTFLLTHCPYKGTCARNSPGENSRCTWVLVDCEEGFRTCKDFPRPLESNY